MRKQSTFLILYLLTASFVYAVDVGGSVGKFFDDVGGAVCRQIDGRVVDVEACRRYRARGNQAQEGDEDVKNDEHSSQSNEHNSASEMYHIAMEQLQLAAKQASSAAAYFLSSGQEYAQETQQRAYEIYKIAKSKLQSAAEQAYDAAGRLIENGQSYVEEARRRSADIYNEALARLNSAAEEAKVIAEEVFEGREAADNGPWEIHDQLQDAYERVTDAAAKGLEKAYETFTELGKEAFQTVIDRRPDARSGKMFDSNVDNRDNGNNAPSNGRRQASEQALDETLTPVEGSRQGQVGNEERLGMPSGISENDLNDPLKKEDKDDALLNEAFVEDFDIGKVSFNERSKKQQTVGIPKITEVGGEPVYNN